MKYLVLLALLLFYTPCFAVDGEVSFSSFADSTYRDVSPKVAHFASYVEIGQEIEKFRPYLKYTTLMDSLNKDVSFHPISIQYEVGIDYQLPKDFYVNVSRMCDHVVDGYPNTSQYWGFKVGWKFDTKGAEK